jgi:hypothetical protein
MKYCHACRTHAPDENRFCTGCGAGFNLKYCPRLHANPRDVDFCAICGPARLSNPGPRPPRLTREAVIVLTLGVSGFCTILLFIVGALYTAPTASPNLILFIVIVTVISWAIFSSSRPRVGR